MAGLLLLSRWSPVFTAQLNEVLSGWSRDGGGFPGAHLHGASCTLVQCGPDPALDDLPHLGSFISSSGQA